MTGYGNRGDCYYEFNGVDPGIYWIDCKGLTI